MHEGLITQAHPSTTWIVVMNGETARFFEFSKIKQAIALNRSQKDTACEEHTDCRLLPVKGQHAVVVANDYLCPHQSLNSRHSNQSFYFVKMISTLLDKARGRNAYENIILVAPAKMLAEFRQQLPSRVQSCVAAVLPKDLVAYDPKNLLAHLQDTLHEAHLA